MPLAEYLDTIRDQSARGQSFCVATVVKVEGSASAKTGSKAVFNDQGQNIFGWVGGGCAERFVGEQSVEALRERRPRVVLADLDDEIFGLGIACGGRMEVFIEPIAPSETIKLPVSPAFTKQAEFFAGQLGLRIEWIDVGSSIQSVESMVVALAEAIGRARNASLRLLRELKNPDLRFGPAQKLTSIPEFKILGKGRIVESLAKWGALFGWPTSVVGPGLSANDYPEKVQCECLLETFDDLKFKENSVVLIASHHASDPDFVAAAHAQGAAYIGMVGSRKRSLEVIERFGGRLPDRVFVPTGIDIDARSPDEIALSILAEIIGLMKT